MAKRKEVPVDESAAAPAAGTATDEPSFNPEELDGETKAPRKQFQPKAPFPWSSLHKQGVDFTVTEDFGFRNQETGKFGAFVLKFKFPKGEYKPSPEVQAILDDHKKDRNGNPTGLVFRDTREHGRAWFIPNDYEGRGTLAKLEMALRGHAEKVEQEQGRGR